MSEPQIDEELIKKYLAGNADKFEKKLIEYFIQQEGAIEVFEKVWEELYQEMNTQPQDKISDPVRMEKWKAVIRQKVEQNMGSQPVRSQRPFIFGRVAIWTMLFLCGALWGIPKFMDSKTQNKAETEWMTYSTSVGKRALIHLSDGSRVYLGAGSSLRYPKRFTAHEREVRLEGEAFFEVAKDPDKPFSVVSGEVVTQVLGTSFKVESFVGTPTLVSVSTGKVRVTQLSEDQEHILADLTAGQGVVWDKQIGVVKTNLTVPTSAEDFMNGKFIFEDRPLAEIVNTLERNYNLDINIQHPALAKKHIRITLEKGLTLKQMMEVLAAAGGFRYTLDKSNTYIKIF